MPKEFSDCVSVIEDAVAENLPEGFYSNDVDKIGDASLELWQSGSWFSFIGELIEKSLPSATKLFLRLCVLVLISALFGAVGRSLSSEALSSAVRFCSSTAIMATVIKMQSEQMEQVEQFFSRLTVLMEAMIPVTGSVWAMGGNVSTASVGTSALYVFLTVCEALCAKSILPVCCALTAFALCNTAAPEMGLAGLSSALKKVYAFFLGMVMTVLLASLSATTALTAAADSTTARAAKLISANIIPVVGASVGDTLRTIATSVQYLKSIVGISGVAFILILVLPVLTSLIASRLAFLLASGFADMVGCDGEKRFISEIGGIYAVLIAVAAMSAVMFIFALTIFSKTAVALA